MEALGAASVQLSDRAACGDLELDSRRKLNRRQPQQFAMHCSRGVAREHVESISAQLFEAEMVERWTVQILIGEVFFL
jgi:hypothetical protein